MGVRPLHVGRSRQSHLIVAWRHAHLFVWSPWHGADSFGATLRVRHGARWTHWRLVLLQRNPINMGRWQEKTQRTSCTLLLRPTLTVAELCRWDTEGGCTKRIGLKSYLRLKASTGGREL